MNTEKKKIDLLNLDNDCLKDISSKLNLSTVRIILNENLSKKNKNATARLMKILRYCHFLPNSINSLEL